MLKFEPVIKDYAWGSREELARLAGRPAPSDGPEAELWVGAHEAGPGSFEDGGRRRGLDEHIAADHDHHLGERSRERFGDRLPFLLKILAADKALSIQAHPDAERAASAPEGTYSDGWPKPEAWIPLVESEAFAGSLPFDVAERRLAALELDSLTAMLDAARGTDRPEHALLTMILTLESERQGPFVREVVAAVERAAASSTDADEARALRTVLAVHEQFPGDVGVVVLLTMKHHVMHPGRSYFIGAGVLHSFVRGTTVEILANSDNVVRGGLTPKKIDVAELLAIVDVTAQVTADEPRRVQQGMVRYHSQVPHFTLWELQPGAEPLEIPAHDAPGLLLALDAPVTVGCADKRVELAPLECAWWPAGDPPAHVTGEPGARLFVATLNDE